MGAKDEVVQGMEEEAGLKGAETEGKAVVEW